VTARENKQMKIEKYSFGVGDRFGYEGKAQLRAIETARELGVAIVPVWNKSHREHMIVGTSPGDLRKEADEAVRARGWKHSYYVDADHIGLKTVDAYIASSDFFTIDVADFIGRTADRRHIEEFVRSMKRFYGSFEIPGIGKSFTVDAQFLSELAGKYLAAVEEAGKVYRHLVSQKGEGSFVPEVSVDEANVPQTPAELFFVLAALAQEMIPVQTIAPKFTGAFLKGVDYVGDCDQFAKEFEDDIAVLAYAVETFGFPDNLKLSVHSGSDKFSLYPLIRRALQKTGAGIHLKTAGTTWLEELIGLASEGGEGLKAAKEISIASLKRYDELCKPYASVVSIDRGKLPDEQKILAMSSVEFASALRHDQADRLFNRHFRQLLHVGYKIAAEMDDRFRRLLEEYRQTIESNVTYNIFERHIRPLFLDGAQERERGKQQSAAVRPVSSSAEKNR